MPDPDLSSYPAPLIVTLVLDAASQAWFGARRAAHFPSDRLLVGAHVTMFHALPGAREAEAAACLAALCAGAAPFGVRVAGLRSLGRGVAYRVDAPAAGALRARIAAAFASDLSPQDRAAWSPHVTVQNKVTPEQARRTLAMLAAAPGPGPVTATGLALWHYRGGPWTAAGSWSFAGPPR